MLALPTGMNRSVERHNINFDAFYDWIEGGVLFDQEDLSGSDVVDILLEENVYSDQDLAWEAVDNAFVEIERRQDWLGTKKGIKVKTALSPEHPWRDLPALAFCLALSFAKWYPKWGNSFGNDFNEQGDLFEALAKQSLEAIFPDWEIHRTGWTPSEPDNLDVIVKDIISRLNEEEGKLEPWTTVGAHEAGLDLLCYRSFPDGRVGVPVLMMQCASGKNWEDKLRTPDLRIWKKLILFASDPKKAFSIPYALSDSEFVRNCNIADAIFLDRNRLLGTGSVNPDWLSNDLRDRMIAWLEPRIAQLPRLNV
jgi:hypothetical protein